MPTERCSSWRSSIRRTGAPVFFEKDGGHHARIARTELGAEASAHELGDHADLRFGQLEIAGQLFAHAGRALRRRIDGEHVGLPVGDHAVRLERRVGLHLGDVAGIHDHVGVLESLLGVALLAHVRPMHIAGLRNAPLRFRRRPRLPS